MLEALIAELALIEDPRCEWKVEHRLLDILVIAVCAVLGEAESFEDIALYGRCKQAWLKQFLALPNGIPSHDTFRRVLMLIDPDGFERCFLDWVRAMFQPEAGAPRQVAIDGKTVRRAVHPQQSWAGAATTCSRSRATGRRPTPRSRAGSPLTPSPSARRSAPPSTRSTTATAAWCAGGCSPARTWAPSP